jgi:hypothetical protein
VLILLGVVVYSAVIYIVKGLGEQETAIVRKIFALRIK